MTTEKIDDQTVAPTAEPEASITVENTPDVWGYVTVRGTARNVRTLPWLVASAYAPAHFAETPFPVTWVEGSFEVTIHLPPGDHTITLCDADSTHATATITVV